MMISTKKKEKEPYSLNTEALYLQLSPVPLFQFLLELAFIRSGSGAVPQSGVPNFTKERTTDRVPLDPITLSPAFHRSVSAPFP